MFKRKDIIFLRFREGNAYYYADRQSFLEALPFDNVNIVHLLAGETFTHQKDRLQIVAWELIPKSYKMDACSMNEFIRKNTDEYPAVAHSVMKLLQNIHSWFQSSKLMKYVRRV